MDVKTDSSENPMQTKNGGPTSASSAYQFFRTSANAMMEAYHALEAAAAKEKSELEKKLNVIKEREERLYKKLVSLTEDWTKFDAERDEFNAQVEKEEVKRAAFEEREKKFNAEVAAMEKKHATNDCEIIHLNVSGTNMSILRRTLCVVEGSILASMFSGRWEEKQKIDENGRVFLNFEAGAFAKILKVLRNYELDPENVQLEIPDASVEPMWNYLALPSVVHFSGSEIIALPKHDATLYEYLPSGERGGADRPELLYSADGRVNADDFHDACDGNGKTLTIVRCTNGYIFGGYNPVSWRNDDAFAAATGGEFLFSLTNPAGAPPAKYPVVPGSERAVYNGGGPAFGCDLYCGHKGGEDSDDEDDEDDGSPFIDFPASYKDTTGRGEGTLTVLDGDVGNEFDTVKVEVWRVGK